jgi:LemA protein
MLFGGYLYNGLVQKEEQVNASWSQVESTMQRKLDLIPNLVKVVKAYAKHEKELLTEITLLRANAHTSLAAKDTAKLASLNSKLNASVMKLFAVAENYPDLKSSEQFLQLQAQIEGSENRINITRMQFNESVGLYNSAIRKMPQSFIASLGSFKKHIYFKAEEKAHKKLEIGL